MGTNRPQTMIVDADSHLVEMPDVWVDHTEASKRHLALSFGQDPLGYDCVVHKGRAIMECHLTVPGDRSTQGAFSELRRKGVPAPFSAVHNMPQHYWHPGARREYVAEWGADGTILFPNWALTWVRVLRDDPESLKVNMGAWNRWAVTVAEEGRGHLYPVGDVLLDDLDWAAAQLRALAGGGVRVVRVPQGLAGGKRPSHPDIDRIWSLFEELDLGVVFHIGATHNRPLDEAWTDDDHAADQAPLLSFAVMAWDVQLVLADLILHGVLERHPRLRIGVMELMVDWVPMFLNRLDSAPRAHESFTGSCLYNLALKPSDYFRRQVRIGTFAGENPQQRLQEVGSILMFGGDFPHSEGEPSLAAYQAKAGAIPENVAESFYGGNARFILGLA
jgi:predicted TIM-barrel fold metal-dependent hydrolase